jgi:dihydroorotase-like cyclic amidohydrolase
LLIDPRRVCEVTASGLLTRHRTSAYIGRRFPVSVRNVWVRGTCPWSEQSGRGGATGRLVKGRAAK